MNGHNAENEDAELGEPILELRDIAEDTRVSFLASVRNKVSRRTTTAQLVAFGFQTPKLIAIEAARMMMQILRTFSKREEE